MKKTYIFLFFLFFGYSYIQAQVPGICGKRFLLGYRPVLSYRIDPLKLNFSQSIHAEYGLSRHISIAANFEYLEHRKDSLESSSFSSDKHLLDRNIFVIGAELKSYNHTDFAPVGLYYGFALKRAIGRFQATFQDSSYNTKAANNYTMLGPILGYSALLSKRLVIDFGGNYFFVYTHSPKVISGILQPERIPLPYGEYYGLGLLQAYIGLSYFLF